MTAISNKNLLGIDDEAKGQKVLRVVMIGVGVGLLFVGTLVAYALGGS